jgi:hypothetical protein
VVILREIRTGRRFVFDVEVGKSKESEERSKQVEG